MSVRVGGILIAVMLLGAVPVAMGEEPAPSITVVGSATVSGRPDTAEVRAGVVTQSVTAAQALAQNSAAMDKVLKVAAGLGIADKDIQTAGVSVVPQRAQVPPGRQQQPPGIVGYEVSNQVNVKVRDLAILGRLLDALVGQGANTLGGIAFSIADPGPLLEQARTRAMADARAKAGVYAAAAGVKVGRVLFIRDATPGIPRPLATRVMAAAPVPVAIGEQDVEVSVSVTYAIE
jgi:uncharacterized protein